VVLAFAASLALLLVAARIFTRASERVGLGLGLSPFVIGVLIVAVGTSLPELVAGLFAVRAGVSEVVAGSVLGSNNSNLLLVMGMVAVAAPRSFALGEAYILIDQHFLLGTVILLGLVMPDGVVDRIEAVFLLGAYVTYVVYLLKSGDDSALAAQPLPGARVRWRDVGLLLVGAAAIGFAAERTVFFLMHLAELLEVRPAVASVTVLAVGSTLPELVIGVLASRRGQGEMAVGLILGSCIFNGLAVLGITSLTGTVEVPPVMKGLALPAFASAALLFYLLTLDKRVSRWEGALFLIIYALFVTKVISAA
jgi:cation:H+ antiporter